MAGKEGHDHAPALPGARPFASFWRWASRPWQVQDQGRPSDAELQLMQQLQGPVTGRVSIPDQRAATLIQPAGKEWRDFWRGTSPGSASRSVALALLVLFF
ncbi:MAG: hypothetical protein R3D25_01960 [Geminicoccaceae bacterium]